MNFLWLVENCFMTKNKVYLGNLTHSWSETILSTLPHALWIVYSFTQDGGKGTILSPVWLCKLFHLIFSVGPSPSLRIFLQMNKLMITQLNTLWVPSADLCSSSLCSSHFSTILICEIQLPWLQCTPSSILPSRKFPRPYMGFLSPKYNLETLFR